MTWDKVPVNSQAAPEAVRLLEYLVDTAGHQIITGQHTQTNPMEEREYIYQVTGSYPKLVGFEMLSYSRNIDREHSSSECLKEVDENRGTIETALRLVKETGCIPVIAFHWFSPLGGSDKSFYTEHTNFDPESVLEEGSAAEEAFYKDLDVIVEELRKFQREKIAVLWRPFHEAEGTWFWWGSKGGEVTAKLYRKMYHYMVDEKKLNHLLWVWSTPTREGYPGDAYVDVIGWDIYLPRKEATDYRVQYGQLRANTTNQKVAALTEVGYMPDVHALEQSHTPWAFYMTWSKEFCIGEQYNTKKELQEMYASPYAVKQ